MPVHGVHFRTMKAMVAPTQGAILHLTPGAGTQGSGLLTRQPSHRLLASHCESTLHRIPGDHLGRRRCAGFPAVLLLRDSLTGATLEQPSAVIVNVTERKSPRNPAWSFIQRPLAGRLSERMYGLAGRGHRADRAAVTRRVARFMPGSTRPKKRRNRPSVTARATISSVRTGLPANLNSLHESRPVVANGSHGHVGLIPVALVVVNVFVKNVLKLRKTTR